eukprot:TRINITY_DN17232_c0_g1_i3.p1 TRINITY_DN17232_c0_g1~~TRINITY_DN17232_c0_g1_i3.p1  ORF type:complete len:418 (-),score=71.41 TRINITY_DN17232_c0_g1_i3:760-2013(-)
MIGDFKVRDGKGTAYFTNILDPYSSATLHEAYSNETTGEIVYRITCTSVQHFLRVASYPLAISEYADKAKKMFDHDVRVAEETKATLKPIDFQIFRNKSLNEMHVEILYEACGKSVMEVARKADAYQILDIAKESSNALVKANEAKCRIKAMPENMISENGKIKLIDFNVSPNASVYAPPELQEKLELPSAEKIDVYYWGMTMYQLMTRKSVGELGKESKMYKTVNGKYNAFLENVKAISLVNDTNKKISNALISILLEVLSGNPEKRPGYKEIQRRVAGIVPDEEVLLKRMSFAYPHDAKSEVRTSEVSELRAEFAKLKRDYQTRLGKRRNKDRCNRDFEKPGAFIGARKVITHFVLKPRLQNHQREKYECHNSRATACVCSTSRGEQSARREMDRARQGQQRTNQEVRKARGRMR